jgi:hypothetical protein
MVVWFEHKRVELMEKRVNRQILEDNKTEMTKELKNE